MTDIVHASSTCDLDQVAGLFREYADWLALEWCAGNIEREITGLPGQYGPPEGCLLLARREGQAVCVSRLAHFTAIRL